LRQLLDAINPNQSSEKGPRLSVARNADSESLSPPWPKVIWKWSESVWNYPDVPQPVAGNTLENMIPDLDTSLKDFPNWPPVFWGSSIVHRSPFRIVAFDKQTGKEQWTITTNTFTPDVPVQQPSDDEQDELNAGYGGFGDDKAFLAGLTSFGIM
jgi:hypothetical protein